MARAKRAKIGLMCANYTPGRKDAISQHFGIDGAIFDFLSEAYPAMMAPILRPANDTEGGLECVPACFGMVPHWADMKLARQTYNARSETVASKPSFRHAWQRKQFCIIPAMQIFEPNYESGKAVRWRIAHATQRVFGIAGLWEWRPAGPDGQPLLSFTMLTINADHHPLMNRFHKPGEEKRMVIMLDPLQYQGWLQGELAADPQLYQPYPADQLVAAPDPAAPRGKAKDAAQAA
jgi:putative SOS response-associated peptidase YedK